MSHEPYTNKEFTIDDVIKDNLRLRQEYNRSKHKIAKLEKSLDKLRKELADAKADYNELLQSK